MARTLQHEAFHQYIHFAVGGAMNAMWFNEGTAGYFEGLEIRNNIQRVRDVETRRDALMIFLSTRRPDFKTLLSKDYAAFYGDDIHDNYVLSGAMMYFLFKSGNSKYRQIPNLYYQAMVKTKDWEKATKEAWKGIDMDVFTNNFIAFWNSRNALYRADNFDPIADKK